MSALQLRKIKQSSLETESCLEDGCNRKGRYALSFINHPCVSDLAMTRGRQELLCPKHAAAWRKLWRDLNGETAEGEAAEAVADLFGSIPQRTEAMFELRGLGYSADAVKRAPASAKRGESAKQILKGLVGAEQVGAAKAGWDRCGLVGMGGTGNEGPAPSDSGESVGAKVGVRQAQAAEGTSLPPDCAGSGFDATPEPLNLFDQRAA